jgi:hypothetical protein
MARHPWFKFYPSDWRGASRLRLCSLAARGLLIEMMGIMHEAEPYGHLMIAGKPVDDATLAVQVGAPRKQVAALREELEKHGVLERNQFGVLFNPRMVRDQSVREKRAAGGSKSAENDRVPRKKDVHDADLRGYPSAIDEGSPQIPDARYQKQIKQKSANADRNGAPSPIAQIVGHILPGASHG